MARTKSDIADGAGSPEATKVAPVSAKTGRPRGRPRKDNKIVKPPSGRPRGRPKGTTKVAAMKKAMEARGASQMEIDAAVAANTPVKGTGRRGRPPKGTTPSKTPTKAAAAVAATPNSTGRRGRGRPRKSAVATHSKEEEPAGEDPDTAEDAEGEEDDGIDAVSKPAAEDEVSDNEASY